LDNADDAVLFNADPEWVSLLNGFDEKVSKMGLRLSCSKTKLQNIASGSAPTAAFINGQCVEAVDSNDGTIIESKRNIDLKR